MKRINEKQATHKHFVLFPLVENHQSNTLRINSTIGSVIWKNCYFTLCQCNYEYDLKSLEMPRRTYLFPGTYLMQGWYLKIVESKYQ